MLIAYFVQDKDSVYLVDFGLACKYKDRFGYHRDSEPDERKAHEGTLEYTCRFVMSIIISKISFIYL